MSEPKSPCIQYCHLHYCGICMGCGRTEAEIARWPHMNERQKKLVIGRIEERAARFNVTLGKP